LKYYLDSSFLVEVIKGEPRAIAILSTLDGYLYTSQLGRTEVIRTIKRFYAPLVLQAHNFLEAINLLSIDKYILERVEGYDAEISLSTADAIHVSSAQELLEDEEYLVTFDKQMVMNAKKLGLRVISS
jgi:predicted nucleic acid-binding protein